MTETGELVDWRDERGFGFVETADHERLFVHISAFERPLRRPLPGDRLAFRRGPGRDGRPTVIAARIAGATARPHRGPATATVEAAQLVRARRIALAAVLLAALMLARSLGQGPDWLVATYVLMGGASFACYAFDKRAALAGRWRVAEATLHLVDFAGGIIGGLLAQAMFHHKTAKRGFALWTGTIAMLHLGFLGLVGAGTLVVPRLL